MSATERKAWTRPALRMLTGVTAVAITALLPGTASADTVEPDRYRIVSALTGQCLALGSGIAELADCGSDTTVWDIVPATESALEEPVPEEPAPAPGPDRLALADGEALLIRNVLDCVGNDGALAECGSEEQQSWTFRGTETGDYTIVAENGKALAVVEAADETAGDTIHTTDISGELGEVWLLEKVE
ncbi:RICIN domain-containing protein [Actinokineospora guangxiensis]|uniref:RICIN domain-containing protein n=1 Tax=Actinokineospora guangxiensis TaxID=1490288 RepID=A0ABW0EIH3_9PSEU